MPAIKKVGLEALLTPDNCVVVLIDHQPFQLANVNSHEPTMVINNVTGLARTAKLFGVPTILTTVTEERGGYLLKALQDVFPAQMRSGRSSVLSEFRCAKSAHVDGPNRRLWRKNIRRARARELLRSTQRVLGNRQFWLPNVGKDYKPRRHAWLDCGRPRFA